MDTIKDLREQFLYCIDYSNIRLKNLPNFVFLCGGCTERKHNDDDVETYQSMRKAIYDASVSIPSFSKKIVLAENTKDWLEHGVVKNLIDFELAIADMAGVIVLILEAPGAFAELGSFSVLPPLSEKLILVVNEIIVDANSYINLGPIKYLEDNSRIVLRYQWDFRYHLSGLNYNKIKTQIMGTNEDILNEAREIIDVISEKSKDICLTSPSLDTSRTGHLCFIIGDLIYNFSSLKVHEILQYLKDYFEVDNISLSTVKSCLFTLEKFNFVERVVNGDTYFVPTVNNVGFLKFVYDSSLKDETGYDSVPGLRSHLQMYYSLYDKSRSKTITRGGKWK